LTAAGERWRWGGEQAVDTEVIEEGAEEVVEDEAHVAPEDLLAEEQKLMEERRNAQEQAQVSFTRYIQRGLSVYGRVAP
jgi:hypothetical protein